jgi:hypothetical protein
MWLQSHAKKIASVIFFWISGCRKKKENTSNTAIIWGVKKLKWTYTILTSKPGMNQILEKKYITTAITRDVKKSKNRPTFKKNYN